MAAKPAKTTKSKRGTELVRAIALKSKNKQISDFGPGDTVNVYVKVKEGEKERVQVYKGTVTKLQGSGPSRSFTVRKISAGVGVERTFPFQSPALDRVERLTIGQVRRAKLYYLRALEGKAAKIESEIAGSDIAANAAAAASKKEEAAKAKEKA